MGMFTAMGFGTGCVTNGRRVYLKEYGPSVPVQTAPDLKGAKVYVGKFDCATNLMILELQTKEEEPEGYKYREVAKADDKVWDKEQTALAKSTSQADWKEIGNMRNGFGMVMSHVYALNDPGTWLADNLRMDLQSQGANVVDVSQAVNADVSISGVIQLCRVDMYFTAHADFVVDIDVRTRQGAVQHRQIHTRGATAASLASEGEFFHALRDCRQKFSIFAIREMAQALKH